MGREELELHRNLFEVRPYFHSHEEKVQWKLQRKEEKLLREQKRKILKHEREIREIEEAYSQIMEHGYDGDKDVDHVISDNRHRFDDEHSELEEDKPKEATESEETSDNDHSDREYRQPHKRAAEYH